MKCSGHRSTCIRFRVSFWGIVKSCLGWDGFEERRKKLMASPNFANAQMVVGVDHRLRRWWENIKQDRALEVNQLLGGLTFLIYFIPDRYLIKALLQFWDPARTIFKFRDFELTPTIEEISGFTDLPYWDRSMIVPHRQTPKKFMKNLGLIYKPKLACLEIEWISLDYLYARFSHLDSYEHFKSEFSCSTAKWKVHHMNGFAIALLGTLVFPREDRNIDTRLIYIVRQLSKGRDIGGNTIVPMILAEMTRALSKCVRGKRFFEGCNFLLQLWAVELFYKRGNLIDILDGVGNKIHTHLRRMRNFATPVGAEEWYGFMRVYLVTTSSENWLNPSHAVARGDELYYIELIDLKGVQPYAPLRVLRQFGVIQVIPLRFNMSLSEYEFGERIPQVHNICRRWERVLTIVLQEDRPYCTPEYYVWILETSERVDLDQGGRPGYEDLKEKAWARNLLNKDYNITPEMREQIVPIHGGPHI